MKNKTATYIVSIIIALAVGGLSALFTRNNMDIYSTINKPPLSPPSVVFPIVWAILFILMGISAAIVYGRAEDRRVSRDDIEGALLVYAFSLILNFFWSIIFFNMQAFLFAFVWLVILWMFIALTIYRYFKVSLTAAYLQIPYLLWVAFAGYLNYMIYVLN